MTGTRRDLFFLSLVGTVLLLTCMLEPYTRAEALPAIPEATAAPQHLTLAAQAESIPAAPTYISLGVFRATAYCPCEKCCGKLPDNPRYGITATGTQATEGRTIAVDPEAIPYGSTVFIDGQAYVAEDRGGAIKGDRIDIFFAEHQAALEYGVQYVEVFAEGVNET